MLKYYGDIEEVHAELNGRQRKIEQAYRAILGNKRALQFKQEIQRLITPQSFWNFAAMQKRMGLEVSGANKFLVIIKQKEMPIFSHDGSFHTPSEIHIYPGFMFHRKGFALTAERYKESGIPPYLGPVIHEYNHFLICVLQEKSFFASVQMSIEFLGLPAWPLPTELIANYIHAKYRDEPRDNVIGLMILGANLGAMDSTHEVSVRALDEAILKHLGFEARGIFSSEPKRFLQMQSEALRAVFFVAVGDPFYGRPLQERIDKITHWEQYFNPSNQVQQNFVDSVKRARFLKEPFPGLSENE